MKTIVQLIITSLFLLIIKCSTNPIGTTSDTNTLPLKETLLVNSSNSFSFKLFKKLNVTEEDKNIFVSPMSISMALGMAYYGANGATKEAMESTLELSGLTKEEIGESYKSVIKSLTEFDPKVTLDIANSIWYRYGFDVKREFIDVTKEYFSAEVCGLDFNSPFATDTINAWVYDKTHGKISKILNGPIDASTMMFLINAIYFAGSWASPFNKYAIDSVRFYKYNHDSTLCKMMVKRGAYRYYSNDLFSSIDLPYGNSSFSMTLFLPHYGVIIDSLIEEFSNSNWKCWINKLKLDSCEIYLPKFKVDYSTSLNEILKSLGMEIAFSQGADFTGINQDNGLFISNVQHNAFVDVDEEGTIAGAVTSIVITIDGSNSHFKTLFFNRPFLFVIHEKNTQSVIFMGKIMAPNYD